MSSAHDPRRLTVNRDSLARWLTSGYQLTRRDLPRMGLFLVACIALIGAALEKLGPDVGVMASYLLTPLLFSIGLVLYAKADMGRIIPGRLRLLEAGLARWLGVIACWGAFSAAIAGIARGLEPSAGTPGADAILSSMTGQGVASWSASIWLACLSCRYAGVFLLILFCWMPVTLVAFAVFILAAPFVQSVTLAARFVIRNPNLVLLLMILSMLTSLTLIIAHLWPWTGFVAWPLALAAPLISSSLIYVIARESFLGRRENEVEQRASVRADAGVRGHA